MLPTASLTIAELFSNPYLLSVPVFQRAYSWDGETAGQLFEDLIEALREKDSVDRSYFLGTILLMDTAEGEATRSPLKPIARDYDIIDGQQRLVTLITLFAVLRDLEDSAKGPIARRTQSFITAQRGSRFFRTEQYRLQLASGDRGFFETYVLQSGGTVLDPELDNLSTSESALLSARNALRFAAGELSAIERNELFDYIADACQIVVIISNEIDRAYRLFVVLNERGKRLQTSDILKADVLSRLAAEDVDWAARQWDAVSLKLGKHFDPFFAHVRAVHGHTKPQIVAGVRLVIEDAGGAAPFLKSTFLPLSEAYASVLAGGDVDAPPQMLRRLAFLNRLDAGDWAPAAILALKNWRDNPARAEMLIVEIDRFAHLLRIGKSTVGKRLQRFSRVVAAIRSGAAMSPEHPCFQFSREELRSIAFCLKDIHKRNQKGSKQLLMRLNDEMSSGSLYVSPSAYTIEHVLPQRPSGASEWRRWFSNPEELGGCVESLGNLTLVSTSQNDKARNASWSEKKKIYADAPPSAPLLAITRDVLAHEEWRRNDIYGREERLVSLMERLWKIDLSAVRSGNRSRVASVAPADHSRG